jgi:hypothetical protein
MQDLFGGVVYAGIDTDKHKYPIGKFYDCLFTYTAFLYKILIDI